jgi:hypothetical protein
MMNMQKLGTVVQSKMSLLNLRQSLQTRMNRASRVIHYANIRGAASRHGLRYSFSFDVIPLTRKRLPVCTVRNHRVAALAAAGVGALANDQSGFYVIPGQSALECTEPKPRQAASLVACSLISHAKQLFHLFSSFCLKTSKCVFWILTLVLRASWIHLHYNTSSHSFNNQTN